MDIKTKLRLQQWSADMAEQKASGLSQEKWCLMKGIPTSTYEYRCKRIRNAMQEAVEEQEKSSIVPLKTAVSEPVFAKIELKRETAVSSSHSGILIKRGDLTIQIAPDSDPEHVRLILEVLSHAE